MMRRASHRLTVLALGSWLAIAASGAPAAAQEAGDIAVVVHRDTPIDDLSVAELRRILLGDREFWSSDQRITLLIRAPVARERDVIVRTVCRMTEARFRQHWIAKVFRAETRAGPRIVYSNEMAADLVARNPGSLALLPSNVAKGGKVVRIDGRLPGEPGYQLR